MEASVTSQFIILSLHPEKGRLLIENTRFRYCLIGSLLMDFLDNGEISLSENKLIPSFRKNGDQIRDMIAERIEKSSRPRRISYWVRILSMKSRLVFRENINMLINKGIVRHEKRYFLNIFPYNRYFISQSSIRAGIIEEIRNILLFDKSANRRQSMLIGLIKASQAYNLLATEKRERRIIRKKCNEFLQKDVMTSEIDKAISEVQAAIIASVAATSAAASAAHS